MRTLATLARLSLGGAVALVGLLTLQGAAGAEPDDAKTSKIIARINGDDVTKTEYDECINGNRRFFDLTEDSVRRRLEGKPWTEFVFDEEILKVRAYAQRHAAELPVMKEAIEAAQKRIQAGEDFAAVAKEVSQDPPTAPSGGSLGEAKGFFDLVYPFNRVALSLKLGEVSAPVLTIFGYHLIKVDRIIPAMEGKPKRVEVRHILIPFSGNPRQEAEEAMAQAKVEILVAKPYCKSLPSYCPEG